MIDAVFISDLHLHPKDEAIQSRFKEFADWIKTMSVNKLFILGDFFHAWAGDDAMDDWSQSIAKQLHALSSHGIELFYMHGNRDFLLGSRFAQQAGWTVLSDPTLIQLGDFAVLLTHGDHYCTQDKAHQRFRRVTRNKWFIRFFLQLPLSLRLRLVAKVRQISQDHSADNRRVDTLGISAEAVQAQMVQFQAKILIHGHTHKSELITYNQGVDELKRYVLSDWDDNPSPLCYNNTRGFFFNLIPS